MQNLNNINKTKSAKIKSNFFKNNIFYENSFYYVFINQQNNIKKYTIAEFITNIFFLVLIYVLFKTYLNTLYSIVCPDLLLNISLQLPLRDFGNIYYRFSDKPILIKINFLKSFFL